MTLTQFVIAFIVGAITSAVVNFIFAICDRRQAEHLHAMLVDANKLADKCIQTLYEKQISELNEAALAQAKSPESFSGDAASNLHAANKIHNGIGNASGVINEQQNATEP
jgi:hypothetical protein